MASSKWLPCRSSTRMVLEDVFIARQPIFDRCSAVAGYEPLFRSGFENRFIPMDSDVAASKGLEWAVMSFRFESITDGKPAFVNLSRRVLLGELYTLLPPDHSVIELLESVEPDADVIAACRRLKESGYRLALDDFVYRPEFEPLLGLADIVTVDFRNEASWSPETLDRLEGKPSLLLAKKVETVGERVQAERLGFELFQGYSYSKPEMMASKAIGPSKANYLWLLKEVGQGEINFDRVETIIRQEVAFSIRLLRYLNSAGFGWRYKVESINHALLLLGGRQLQKWVAAVATVGLAEGKPTELLVTGLLSVMDAVSDQPLDQVVESMGASPELTAGLLRREPPFGPVLDLVVAQERGDWGRLDDLAGQIGTPTATVQEAYHTVASSASSLAMA